jgi:hypothetical protein
MFTPPYINPNALPDNIYTRSGGAIMMQDDARSTYNRETEIDVYGGSLSCGEVDLDDTEDDTEPYVTSHVVDGGGGSKKRVDARSAKEDGVFDSSASSGGEADEAECGECSIAVDGPVCSDTRAVAIVKDYLKQKERSVVSSGAVEIIAAAKDITDCKTEECALVTIAKENPMASAIVAETIRDNFKVDGPADSTKWLNNSNIDDILAQLVRKHPSVYHMPFHMIDFEDQDLPSGKITLKNVSLVKDVINRGKDMFCVVINTDKYGNPGLHWFALFCDFRGSPEDASVKHHATIEYFNSSGASAPLRIKEWMSRAEMELEAAGYPTKRISAAVIQHQRSDTECGVYSLYYIYRRIKGASVEEFATRIPDAQMIAFRKKMFRNRETSPAT